MFDHDKRVVPLHTVKTQILTSFNQMGRNKVWKIHEHKVCTYDSEDASSTQTCNLQNTGTKFSLVFFFFSFLFKKCRVFILCMLDESYLKQLLFIKTNAEYYFCAFYQLLHSFQQLKSELRILWWTNFSDFSVSRNNKLHLSGNCCNQQCSCS